MIIGVRGSVRLIITVAKKRLEKTKGLHMSCDYSENWGVWFSYTVIITMLKAVAKKRLVKAKDLHVSCDYSENCSVWFTGTVMVGCGGNQ
jgi:phage anti-repressor protein